MAILRGSDALLLRPCCRQAEKVYNVYIAALDMAGNPPSLAVLELKTPDSAPPRCAVPTLIPQAAQTKRPDCEPPVCE